MHIFAAYNPMAVVSSCFSPCMSHMVAACTSWGFNCPEGPCTHLRFHHHQQFHNVHNAQWQGFGLALASWQVLDLKDRKLHTLRIEILRNPFVPFGIPWDIMGSCQNPQTSDDIWNPHEIPMKSPWNPLEIGIWRWWDWGLGVFAGSSAGGNTLSIPQPTGGQCALLVAVPIVL